MLSLNSMGAASDLHCHEDLSVFHVDTWRMHQNSEKSSSADFFYCVLPHLLASPVMVGQAQHKQLLHRVLEQYIVDAKGLFVEFGVYTGTSINIIARRLQAVGGGRVYGFDSFSGLPSTWQGGSLLPDFQDLPAGYFRLPQAPRVEHNVRLMIGLFNETVPRFARGLSAAAIKPNQTFALVHLDADLYHSTWEALIVILPLLTSGCILVIDDFLNFPGFLDSALKALGDALANQASPQYLEVLAAPFMIYTPSDLHAASNARHPHMSDIERAVALRVL